MSAPTALASLSEIVRGLFPWLARCGLAASGALSLRGANGRTELEGGGAGVARVGDLVVRLVKDSVTGTIYVSTDENAPRSWTPVDSVVGAPLPTTGGTRVAVTTGSAKVTCG